MTAAERLKKWCDTKAAVVLGTSGVFTPTGEVGRLREAMVVALEEARKRISVAPAIGHLAIASRDDCESRIRALLAELEEKP